jgi:hypothetical protein
MKCIHFFTIIAVLGLLMLGTAPSASAGGLPDLTVTSAKGVFLGGQWHLQYTVQNIGTASSGSFSITIMNRAGVIKQLFQTTNINPGSSRTFLHRTGVCEFYRKVVVDGGNAVRESNEINNTRAYENFC